MNRTNFKRLIHPFAHRGGGWGWEGTAVQYVWGGNALALGRHFDADTDAEDWDSVLEKLEVALVQSASGTLGYMVGLVPEYI